MSLGSYRCIIKQKNNQNIVENMICIMDKNESFGILYPHVLPIKYTSNLKKIITSRKFAMDNGGESMANSIAHERNNNIPPAFLRKLLFQTYNRGNRQATPKLPAQKCLLQLGTGKYPCGIACLHFSF